MNKDQLKRKAKQLKGEVEQQWSKNIDDDLAQIAGQRDVFEENIPKNYGITKNDAREELYHFFHKHQKNTDSGIV